MANGDDRREVLLAAVLEQGYCTTSELAQLLDVSEMTVRRDVARLEQSGQLRSVHGGVTTSLDSDMHGTRFDVRAHAHTDIKRAIARRALEFLPDNGIIAIDAGTTTAELTAQLPDERISTIVTYSLPVLNAASRLENIDLMNLGGAFHRESQSYAGPSTIRAIENLSIGTLFLGTSGVSERGLFCGNDFDAVTKRALIDVSETVILLADSTKFRTTAVARVCGLDRIDHLVVDADLDETDATMLRRHGVAITRTDAPVPSN
ncbi:MAG TPA: DeoR/GlpR family DNA-binding transcription regulator [Candidatus Agrococcus pullicola]|uniref:DeoR/GlpR family DNA-binding transcription regulator n=1 Tax=Candidatus Agrococcus pullicola TaxID=2838429 RepID=A0A9D2C7I4_9MICO|nr:DeoR/GlpR family DNA-binding transcription regulator [Candidatus Agrococcus pullicola]